MARRRLIQLEASGAFGRYVLQERLGSGASGEVFRALHGQPDGSSSQVALKRLSVGDALDPAQLRRFIADAQPLTKLRHRNLVSLYECSEVQGTAYVAMELVDGRDLGSWMRLGKERGVRLDLPVALHIVAEAARGLGHVHGRKGAESGLVHGDVAPGNLLIGKTGEVKLADAGLDIDLVPRASTDPSVRIKRAGYRAPEQLSGGKPDRRSDLFALGLIFYEMLTGSLPFAEQGAITQARLLVEQDVEAPSARLKGLPADIDAVVCTLLARDPAVRYQCAEDLVGDLELLQEERSLGYTQQLLGELVQRIEANRSAQSSLMLRALEPEMLPPPPRLRLVTPELEFEDVAPQSSVVVPVVAKTVAGRRKLPRSLVAMGLLATGLWATALGGMMVRQKSDRIETAVALAPSFEHAPVVAQPVPRELTPPPQTIVEGEPVVLSAPKKEEPKERPAAHVRLLDGKPVVTDDQLIDGSDSAELYKARAAYRKAEAAMTEGKVEEAEAAFQAALSAYPGYVSSYRGLAEAYAKQGNTELAVASAKLYLNTVPNAADAPRIRRWARQLENE